MNSERRQNPRTKVAALAYINFEPNNGGIVLNVSEGGLCFHAVTPVQLDGTLRFWFSAEGRRVEASGELAWTDESRKAGGVRFGILPAAVRDQVRGWMDQCAILSVPEKTSARMIAPAHQSAQFRAGMQTNARQRTELAATSLRWPRANFVRGWVSGLVTAALIAAAFFLNTHRRQVGESLISLGERFAAKPATQITLGAPPPAPATAPARATGPAPTRAPASAPAPVPASASAPVPARASVPAPALVPASASAPLAASAPALRPKAIAFARAQSPPAAHARSGMKTVTPRQAKPRIGARSSAISPVLPITSSRTRTPALESAPNSIETSEVPQPETAADSDPPGVEGASTSRFNADADVGKTPDFGAPPGKYLEVGQFRRKTSADLAINSAKALGVPVIVVHKSALWFNFYHVLAGPYKNQNDAELARGKLQTRGFKPRELPNRSRHFTLPLMTLYGTDVSVTDCTITWELYSPYATVTFVKGNTVIATAQGKWVKRNYTYKTNSVVNRSNERGLRTLLEIQCHGMDEALVLGGPEPVRYFIPPPNVGL
jgi:PilZ domain/SPOR domain